MSNLKSSALDKRSRKLFFCIARDIEINYVLESSCFFPFLFFFSLPIWMPTILYP